LTVALVSRELLMATRIADAAARADVDCIRVDEPALLPAADTVGLVLVDWAERQAGWADALAQWCQGAPESHRPRVVLFGPHTDLEAHSAARAAGLGPMWARSKLLLELPGLIA
jgi:hypothetical protein